MSGLVALLATGLFAGAAFYISVAEHPSRFHLAPSAAVIQFRHSYARAAIMQASLAAIGCIAGLVTAITMADWIWGAAALLIGAPIPFTLLIIMRVNKRLQNEVLNDADATALLRAWGRLHWARTAASLAAFVLMIGASFS